MDPYLEEPGIWRDVHHELLSNARDLLSDLVGESYIVTVEERVYISDETDPGRALMFPDVAVISAPTRASSSIPPNAAAAGVIEPIEATTLIEDEIHEPYLEVRDVERRHVVTVIEVLSPTNKLAGSRGRESYLEKRRQLLRSTTHLLEIDLLRDGQALAARESLPPCDYRVHLSRQKPRPRALIWPIRLDQRLPPIPVPLNPQDGEVLLDLQRVLDVSYDRGRYARRIDYRREPAVPLSKEQAVWAHGVLAAKGLR